jgi:hypothetical protein
MNCKLHPSRSHSQYVQNIGVRHMAHAGSALSTAGLHGSKPGHSLTVPLNGEPAGNAAAALRMLMQGVHAGDSRCVWHGMGAPANAYGVRRRRFS